MSEWPVYRGEGVPVRERIESLPEPPRWRRFDGEPLDDVYEVPPLDSASSRRLGDRPPLPVQEQRAIDLINAALFLRRPLLVTGDPGAGKSTLAHALAHELDLGRVLQWPIVSRTELRSGLYEYDAIGRLQDAQAQPALSAGTGAIAGAGGAGGTGGTGAIAGAGGTGGASGPSGAADTADTAYATSHPHATDPTDPTDPTHPADPTDPTASTDPTHPTHPTPEPSVAHYVRLGPLGTALLPLKRPRVLLIDELDKSDIDLPNDLLNVMEEGEFVIPALERIADRAGQRTVRVLTDDGRRVPVTGGRVRCHAFPVIVMTSNGEREFPAPLMRRCIHLHLDPPRGQRLAAMVQAHFGDGADAEHQDLVEMFTSDRGGAPRPTDQLLNAIYLTQRVAPPGSPRRAELARLLMGSFDAGPR
ncbi:AAA family ATPase [Streptomyces sp. NPDC056716]|uniref:AAA family ATPase n=1 Tax=unclassified Streptomyces TaxID=2593676 RepID=UPI00367C3D65